jgi:iron complex transport system permease protein
VLLATVLICLGVGSQYIAPGETVRILLNAIRGIAETDQTARTSATIILSLRLPRVLCAGLIGASLSLCGAAMQGLLRNPLADGSILGVSSGGALGAALAIVAGISIPGIPLSGNVGMAMVFSFGSLMIVLFMAYSMDRSLATHTIILTGVIYSMLASALLSLLMAFAGNKLQNVTFWTMGSLSGRRMNHVLIMLGAFVLFGGVLMRYARELNHFALGEENARRVGVPVRKVKLVILIAASALIGVCVAVGGSIAFVGLIVPHMVRMITGPNHRKQMPVSVFAGAVFLMLTDLLSRSVLTKGELPIGVVTSLIGAVTFAGIFRSSRKGGKRRAGG